MSAEPLTFRVDPARLASGEWTGNKEEGEGDIHASYSADRICEEKPIRSPFRWEGAFWVCVSITGKGLTVSREDKLCAYRLLPREAFQGQPTTYRHRASDSEMARNDPNGFYHGVTVHYGGKVFIMCGPPATFIAAERPARPNRSTTPEAQQLDLF